MQSGQPPLESVEAQRWMMWVERHQLQSLLVLLPQFRMTLQKLRGTAVVAMREDKFKRHAV